MTLNATAELGLARGADQVPTESNFRTGGRGRDGRVRINVGNKPKAAEWLREQLGQGGLSGLFSRGNQLVHTPAVDAKGYIPPKDDGAHDGPAQIRPISVDEIASLIETRYDVGHVKMQTLADGKKEKHWEAKLLSRDLAMRCASAHAVGAAPNLRPLRSVTHTPTMRADGSVLDVPGYDAASGSLYLPASGMGAVRVPDRPTASDIAQALELVLYPVSQFPWVSDDDLANWVGCALTPLIRAIVPPPYQFGIIEAPSPGSGKSYLVGVLDAVHGAVMRPSIPTKDEEWTKVTTTVLTSTTAPIVCFDNVRGVVHSAVLEGLLTMAIASDRTLGKNTEQLILPNDRLWMMTGNNAQIGGDLARRTLRMTIDPNTPNPEARTGFRCNPVEWTVKNRAEYVAALLTFVRAWVVAGRPMPDADRSDSYATWIRTVRGILAVARLGGTFANTSERREVSADDEEWRVFVEAVLSVFPVGSDFTAKDLAEHLIGHTPDIPSDLLPGSLADRLPGTYSSPSGFVKSLGAWLANRVGRPAGAYKVVARGVGTTGARKNRQLYAVDSFGDARPPAVPSERSQDVICMPAAVRDDPYSELPHTAELFA